MAVATYSPDADSPTRKRSFTFDDEPSAYRNSPSPKKVEFCIPEVQLVAPTPCNPARRSFQFHSEHRRRKSVESKAGRGLGSYRTNMQTQSSPRMFAAPMPFTSVIDDGTQSGLTSRSVSSHESESRKEPPRPSSSGESSYASFSSFHQPRNSTSTSASESSDSSPTTTVSTMDSSSMSESSPGTSPETPASHISPLSTIGDGKRFKPPERSRTEPFFEMQRPATPAKKARNLKNLAVDTSTATYSLSRAVTSTPPASHPATAPIENDTSAPASPTFVKPPTPPRRKLSNLGLTIVTQANSNLTRLTVPQTPSMTRPNTLRHFQSSPSLPLLSPSTGPQGGMRLPTIRDHSALEGFADIPLEGVEEDQEPNFDVPQSLEEKADSYPNGPIRIYESGVDLYYEPSLEVACQYDVILNVASEVKNPFLANVDAALNTALVQSSPTVGILVNPSKDTSSPSTPKATPITPQTDLTSDPMPCEQPEYIHIPWEHNTDIVPDLHRLVKLIDERVSQGKRVLVHCQCGVSRSASLIVAYGLYKNPGITVQEAYDAVKRRSKWIGPNMNLIMQLQEFRSSLLRTARRDHGYPSQLFTLPRKISTAVSSASTSDHFTPQTESGPVTPRTAPLPPEAASPLRASTGNIGPFSAGPVEPGSGSFWEPGFRRSWGSNSATDLTLQAVSVSDTPYVDAKGHLVPVVKVMEKDQSQLPVVADSQMKAPVQDQPSVERLKSLKRKTINFSKPLPLRRDEDTDSPMFDAPLTLLSPRSEEFHMAPLGNDVTASETQSHDSSNIFSPLATSFPPNPFDSLDGPSNPSTGGLSLHEQIRQLRSFQSSPPIPKTPENRNGVIQSNATLTTPPRQRSIRTKFSSPSMREQIRLHRLQTQIESQLPQSPGSHHSLDDIDALMSPRATEFTVNPFHKLLAPRTMSLQPQVESKIPGTPKSAEADPRSPAQHGISPITRNIFDVL